MTSAVILFIFAFLYKSKILTNDILRQIKQNFNWKQLYLLILKDHHYWKQLY